MCKHLNKTKRDEEDEEVEEEGGGRGGGEEGGGGRGERGEGGHASDTSHQLNDHYLQQQNGDHYNGDDDDDDDDAKEVKPSTMTSNRSKTANTIHSSTNEMESSISILDSPDNCSFTRPAVNLTNTDYTSNSTKFTINEILKPDFGICKGGRVRHQRMLHENVTLLSYQHQPQVISFGSTGGILIPISHYAPSIYSSTSCITPTARLASPLATPPVSVQASGSSSSLIASSPLSSSSSSPSLVRYGSGPVPPSSLGLHHHLLHHQTQSASSSATFHSFTETRQHRSRHRPHEHSQNRGSVAVTYNNNHHHHQINLSHSQRNQHHHDHHHVQHGSNHQREESTHRQHVGHVSSRNQQHQLQQQHPSSNNPRLIDREHFLDPTGSGSSDLTTKESGISSNPSVTSVAIATTTHNTINHDDDDGDDDDEKITSGNDSNELHTETNEPSSNPATLYEGTAPFVWPAWVYCTRYSDRPSSGPRSRKLKKRDRSADDKRPRTSFTSDQLLRLKQEFDDCRYLTEDRRKKLARELSLSEAQIKIWFQNKRAKIKKSSGMKNPLALHLMAQGLYNHSTVSIKDEHYTNEATF